MIASFDQAYLDNNMPDNPDSNNQRHRTRSLPEWSNLVIRALDKLRLCAIPGAMRVAGGDYLPRGRRGLAGAGGGASRATTLASHARACGDVSQGSAASA